VTTQERAQVRYLRLQGRYLEARARCRELRGTGRVRELSRWMKQARLLADRLAEAERAWTAAQPSGERS